MATREGIRPRLCVMCPTDLLGGTVYLVDGVRRGRRTKSARFLICGACYERGRPDPDTGRTRAASVRRTEAVEWWGLAGRGKALPPQVCVAGCGLVVVRGAKALMQGVTCSRACRTSLMRKRNGGRGSGRPCGSCGEPVTAGRADSAYCGPACRQKAYRRRVAGRASDPVAELLAALAPFVVASAPGISHALYKALYRVHTAHLRGHDMDEFLARIASMNPERVKIPDTDDGHRLRNSIRSIRPSQPLARSRNGDKDQHT
ncbi:hypothetical protein ACFXJ6_37230 [Streptomyces sp. NPDC059218]|uniref:hypothetical protein n=1 Tax=unclassified Streptomyces TaxID=2593676 RepID=UPI0036D04256